MKHLFWSFLFCSQCAFSNPVGEVPVAGEVAFTRPSEKELNVFQFSDRAIIQWEKFSIDSGELTKFFQPGPDSIVLNRVVGGDLSTLFGKLEANGQVILLNPNGVLIGQQGEINAAAFHAVNSEIADFDFMQGSIDFSLSNLGGLMNVEERLDATVVEKIGGRVFLVSEDVTIDVIPDEMLNALQQIRTEMPERLWVQEFSLLIHRKSFRDQIKVLMNRNKRESSIPSCFALAHSTDYLIRSTMSGENIRLMDRYQEFEQSPFWRTPEMLKTLYWLEDRK